MEEDKRRLYENSKSITELELLKSNNSLKEEIEEKFDKKIDEVKSESQKTSNTLVRVEVLLENMGKNTEEIRKEMKEDRENRKIEEEERKRRHYELESQIQSVKQELNQNVEQVERKITSDIQDLRLGLDSKLNIEDFEIEFKKIEDGSNSDEKENKTFKRNLFINIVSLILAPSVILDILRRIFGG
ncbi:membrane protein [Staphylococcus phage MarsHill]|nr:membrane protein [Staphylococcus phage MarsHill]QQO92704.1 membrane protein [Staphylococcus phage Madawaska]